MQLKLPLLIAFLSLGKPLVFRQILAILGLSCKSLKIIHLEMGEKSYCLEFAIFELKTGKNSPKKVLLSAQEELKSKLARLRRQKRRYNEFNKFTRFQGF